MNNMDLRKTDIRSLRRYTTQSAWTGDFKRKVRAEIKRREKKQDARTKSSGYGFTLGTPVGASRRKSSFW